MLNYFKLFNIKQEYNIDKLYLDKQYYIQHNLFFKNQQHNVSKNKHCDKLILINQGYKILKDDYLRSVHLLKLLGYDMQDITRSKSSCINLNELFNEYELIDNAIYSTLLILKKQKNSQKDIIIHNLNDCFSKNKLEDAIKFTIHLNYITNMIKYVSDKIKNKNV